MTGFLWGLLIGVLCFFCLMVAHENSKLGQVEYYNPSVEQVK